MQTHDKRKAGDKPGTYLEFLVAPFFRWWWAAISVVATMASWFISPSDTVSISKAWFSVATFVFLGMLFLTLSVLSQGWRLYKATTKPFVDKILRTPEDSSHVFMIGNDPECILGGLMEVYRVLESQEILIALLQVDHITEDGTAQAKPIWISPIHLLDIEQGKVSAQSLVVRKSIGRPVLDRWVRDLKPPLIG